jgi:hypothetical protein
VNELEGAIQRIQGKLSRAIAPKEQPDLEQEVARFVMDLEQNSAKAPMEERKMLVQKCISKIVVDREQKVSRFYVRRVPAINPMLEEVEKCSKNEEDVMNKPLCPEQDLNLHDLTATSS